MPDYSSLTCIRDRYGIDICRRFFERIVEQRQAAGLVWGREFHSRPSASIAGTSGSDG